MPEAEDSGVGWRIPTLILEGLRSARSGGLFGWSLILLSGLATFSSGAIDGQGLADSYEEEALWRALGGEVFVVSNDDSPIRSQDCAAAAASPLVSGSVALAHASPRASIVGSRDSVPLTVASAGLFEFLSISPPPGEALVSEELAPAIPGPYVALSAQSTGVDSNPAARPLVDLSLSSIPLLVGQIPVDPSIPDDYLVGIIFVSDGFTQANACLIRARPGYSDGVEAILPALVPSLSQLAPNDVRRAAELPLAGSDFAHARALRATRLVAVGSSVIIALVCVALSWFRRSSDAVYLTVGLERWQLLVVRSAETLSIAALGIAIGTLLSLAMTLGTRELPMVAALASSAMVALAMAGGAVSGVVLSLFVTPSSPSEAIRE